MDDLAHSMQHISADDLGPAAIARRLGIGRASVYRLLGKQNGRANGTRDADQA